ncbi:unnamed protein product [Hermetia illucens]|uniref:Single domain-containing protein n=1 Tax=Hermetia illucens TaxID=343691 RepID=A0A7R8YZD4_HERIL|nr:uncharacterized protein LOC119654809 [Hermetia illucens]CAD7087676.1 unnamed protein product [Hermetia illucens]
MKFVVCVVAVVAVSYISLVESAVWRGVANDINHPGKCVIDKDVLLDYGQEYHPPNRCEKISCLQGGEIAGYSCGVKVIENCRDGGYVDVSKNYPECCLKKFICKEKGKEKIVEL